MLLKFLSTTFSEPFYTLWCYASKELNRTMRIIVVLTKAILLLTLLSYAPIIQSVSLGTLTVKVIGLRNSKGNVGFTLFNQAKGFPTDSKLSHREGLVELTGTSAEIKIDNLAHGTYGVGLIHDENKNNKMDRNFFGIPLEGFGISNNPKVVISTPSYNDAKFHFNQHNHTITIRMKYL